MPFGTPFYRFLIYAVILSTVSFRFITAVLMSTVPGTVLGAGLCFAGRIPGRVAAILTAILAAIGTISIVPITINVTVLLLLHLVTSCELLVTMLVCHKMKNLYQKTSKFFSLYLSSRKNFTIIRTIATTRMAGNNAFKIVNIKDRTMMTTTTMIRLLAQWGSKKNFDRILAAHGI